MTPDLRKATDVTGERQADELARVELGLRGRRASAAMCAALSGACALQASVIAVRLDTAKAEAVEVLLLDYRDAMQAAELWAARGHRLRSLLEGGR